MKLIASKEIVGWRALMETHKTILSILESRLLDEDFTVPRFQIMFFLYFEGALSPSEVASKMTVTRGNITSFFKRMMADELIEAVYEADKARPLYILTERGRHDFESVFPKHVSRLKKLLKPILNETIENLQNLRAHAEALSDQLD